MARGVPTKVPEGGWGWMVCLASSWTNGVVFGIINSFGVLYVVMVDLDGATAFKTSWIGSVCAGLTFFMSPFASIITDKFGCRPTAVVGGVIALAGSLASNFATRIEHMYVTYGFLMGLGFAIAYQPSMYILGIYFQRRLGIANGLVCFGSSIFTIALPFAMRELLANFGLKICLWFQCSLVFFMVLGGLTYRPRPEVVEMVDLKEDYGPVARQDSGEEVDDDHHHLRERRRGCSCCKRTKCCCSVGKVFDLSIWKERNYRIWAIAVPLGVLGYFVPFFHLVKHVNDTLPEARAEVLIMLLGATSGVGRLVSGFLSDHPKINPVYIQQLSFLVIGVSTTVMPVIRNFIGLCALILVMGLFDGAFVAMMGPIAFNFVGPKRASQAIGCILGLMSIPMMLGPPIAGIIYDITGSYDIAFICSGVPPIICACILFFIRPEPRRETESESDGEENVDEKGERAIMIPREVSPGMEAKEAELQAMLRGFGHGGAKGERTANEGVGKRDNGGGGCGGNEFQVYNADHDHGRRRSFFRNRTSESDTRIIMTTGSSSHDADNHHPNGVCSNGEVHGYRNIYSNGGLGVVAGAYGLEGSRSPYAPRGQNSSKHFNGNNNVPVANGNVKMEMNGFIHRSDSKTHETSTKIIIVEKETAV